MAVFCNRLNQRLINKINEGHPSCLKPRVQNTLDLTELFLFFKNIFCFKIWRRVVRHAAWNWEETFTSKRATSKTINETHILKLPKIDSQLLQSHTLNPPEHQVYRFPFFPKSSQRWQSLSVSSRCMVECILTNQNYEHFPSQDSYIVLSNDRSPSYCCSSENIKMAASLKEIVVMYQSLKRDWDKKPPNLDRCGEILTKLKVCKISDHFPCSVWRDVVGSIAAG